MSEIPGLRSGILLLGDLREELRMQQGKKNVFSTDLCILILIAVACVYMFCASIPLTSEARLFPQVI